MIQIGELAKKIGISTRAIRYYERIGLLKNTKRSPSGYRLYGENAVVLLEFLKKAQKVGFTLQEIQAIWEIRNSGKKPCSYVKEHAKKKIDAIEQKIRELEELRNLLIEIQKGWDTIEMLEDQRKSVCPLIEKIKK